VNRSPLRLLGAPSRCSNAGDEVILIDNGVPNGLEIDRVVYDDGITFPDPVGASMALSAPDLDNDLGGNWCVSSVPYGDGDLGTPGAPNETSPATSPEVASTPGSTQSRGPYCTQHRSLI
jgi:hypothetical protein